MTTCNSQNPYDSSRLCATDAPHHGHPHDDGLGRWDKDGQDVSNDVHTRRLIVTLPIVSGEEADSIAECIDSEVLTDGFTSHGTVTHALGETLPEAFTSAAVRGIPGFRYVYLVGETATDDDDGIPLSPAEARQLAGVLLARAHEIDGE